MESILRLFLKESVSSFVKEQTQKAGWKPEFCVQGYLIKDLIEFGHKVPVCDLIRILSMIDKEATMIWSVDLQIQVYKIRSKKTLH